MPWIPLLFLIPLFLTVLFNVLAFWRGWIFIRSLKKPLSTIPSRPGVSLIIPVCGIEGDQETHFRKFTRLSWTEYELIFTVLDPMDPAIPVLQKLESTPSCRVIVSVGGEAGGQNPKVQNLINGFSKASYDWLIVCDADVQPDEDWMEAMMEGFFDGKTERKEVGLVHALYRCREEKTWGAALENVWINCDFWVQGLLGDWIKGTDFAFGAAMAFRRETLDRVGGFTAIQDYLADDFQLGNRISKLGLKIQFSRRWVTLGDGSNSFLATWKHLLRWSRTIRVCQPSGFTGSILLNMSFWAILGLLIDFRFFLPWSSLVLILRLIMGNQCYCWASEKMGIWIRFPIIPLKDLMQFALWILAFRNASVEWRGKRYRLARDGKLEREF